LDAGDLSGPLLKEFNNRLETGTVSAFRLGRLPTLVAHRIYSGASGWTSATEFLEVEAAKILSGLEYLELGTPSPF
jgi:hypothetical protein